MEPQDLVTETEQVNDTVQENANEAELQTSNESPVEGSGNPVNTQDDINTQPEVENQLGGHLDTSDEIQKKLDKLKEYEVKENEINQLREKLGDNGPQDNLIFQAQRGLAIAENLAQQNYIALCNKYGVDYREDKINESAAELQEKDPKAFYELRYELEKLTSDINNKREQVNNFITERDISLAMERNNAVFNASPAIKDIVNQYAKDYKITGSDIDNIVKSSMLVAQEAYEMGRQASLQERNKVSPSQVLNNNVINTQATGHIEPTPTFTLEDVQKMDLATYAKNASLIDKLYAEGKLK